MCLEWNENVGRTAACFVVLFRHCSVFFVVHFKKLSSSSPPTHCSLAFAVKCQPGINML